MRFQECCAILTAYSVSKKTPKTWKRNGEPCGSAAAFVSRGNPCCYIHYQADTAGPRAGKVEFKK
jgi:hypothetical protein